MSLNESMFFRDEPKMDVKEALHLVYDALEEKGYNGINQIVGYLISGDPSYITSYNGAKRAIIKFERDELIEELLKAYFDK